MKWQLENLLLGMKNTTKYWSELAKILMSVL